MIDYVAKYCLAATVTTTCRGTDALPCLDLAVAEAQRLLNLTDLGDDLRTLTRCRRLPFSRAQGALAGLTARPGVLTARTTPGVSSRTGRRTPLR